MKAYLEFSDNHFKQYGFRCNIPLGSYFIRQDTSSILSYSHDGDIISLESIHAYSDRDKSAWEYFLQQFNAWAHSRGGIPLLNQSPFVEKAHVVAAYGERWKQLSDWIRTVDPDGRMPNLFLKSCCGNHAYRHSDVAEEAGVKSEGILRKRLLIYGCTPDAVLYAPVAEDLNS